MTLALRDLASTDLWEQSLERSRRRRALAPRLRREHKRRKRVSLAVVAATVAGPGTGSTAALAAAELQTAVAAETPSHRAIELREGGLPLMAGSQGPLVAEVQRALGVSPDGVFGPQTDAAVRAYQGRAGLSVDGIVGPVTWGTLFAQSAVGGSDVPQGVRDRIERRLVEAAAVAPEVPAPEADSSPGPTAPQSSPAPVNTSCGSATISSPVHGTQSSPFGPRGGRNHDGVDLAAPTGTPVRAAACGTVSMAGQQSGYGNIICITHTSRFSTCYAHLSRFATSQGAQVRQGQVIGYVGCTGNCTGPHLHFETRVGGQPQNPSMYLSGGRIPGKTSSASAVTTARASGPTAKTASVGGATSSGSGGAGAVAPAASVSGAAERATAAAAPAAPAPVPAAPVAPTAPAPVAPAPPMETPAPPPAPVAPTTPTPAPVAPATPTASPAPAQTTATTGEAPGVAPATPAPTAPTSDPASAPSGDAQAAAAPSAPPAPAASG